MKHIKNIQLLSWTEKEWNGNIELFYSTLFVTAVHNFITNEKKKEKVPIGEESEKLQSEDGEAKS